MTRDQIRAKATLKELEALRTIADDSIYQEDGETWVEELFQDRALAGAFSSACRKDLAWTTGETCGLTDAGKDVLRASGWKFD